jgi:DNA-binding beta-propeller fold protein YncE
VISEIVVLVSIIILPYHISAQTLDIIVNQRNFSGHNIPYFKVGHSPGTMILDTDKNIVYVANPGSGSGSGTVSVINGYNKHR